MPAKSKAQRNLMAAAEHGAQFPLAKQVRASMTPAEMNRFAATPAKGLPAKVAPAAKQMPHANLGKWLHPARKR